MHPTHAAADVHHHSITAPAGVSFAAATFDHDLYHPEDPAMAATKVASVTAEIATVAAEFKEFATKAGDGISAALKMAQRFGLLKSVDADAVTAALVKLADDVTTCAAAGSDLIGTATTLYAAVKGTAAKPDPTPAPDNAAQVAAAAQSTADAATAQAAAIAADPNALSPALPGVAAAGAL